MLKLITVIYLTLAILSAPAVAKNEGDGTPHKTEAKAKPDCDDCELKNMSPDPLTRARMEESAVVEAMTSPTGKAKGTKDKAKTVEETEKK